MRLQPSKEIRTIPPLVIPFSSCLRNPPSRLCHPPTLARQIIPLVIIAEVAAAPGVTRTTQSERGPTRKTDAMGHPLGHKGQVISSTGLKTRHYRMRTWPRFSRTAPFGMLRKQMGRMPP